MLVLEGTLKQHLIDVAEQAHETLEQLIENIRRFEEVSESLKSQNQQERVQRMNGIKRRAVIIILDKYSYA